MATGARHELYIVRETAYGGAPQIPELHAIPITGTTLALTKDTFQSALLRSDRQIQDFRHGMRQVGGGIDVEMKGTDYDDLLAGLFSNEWEAATTVTLPVGDTPTINAAASGIDSGGTDLQAAGFAVGDEISMTGWTNAENNVVAATIAEFTTPQLMVLESVALVDETATADIVITSTAATLKLGEKRISHTVVRQFTDIQASDDFVFHGVEMNTFDLTVSANAIVTASFGAIGKNQSFIPDYVDGGTVIPATASSVMDAFTGQLSEGGQPIATVTEITLNIDNGMEVRPVIGSDSTLRPGQARFNATGQITAYFEDVSLLKKFLDETDTSLLFEIRGRDGRSYTFDLPRISFSGGQPDVPDEGDVMLTMPFQALLETTKGTNLTIIRA